MIVIRGLRSRQTLRYFFFFFCTRTNSIYTAIGVTFLNDRDDARRFRLFTPVAHGFY